MEEILIEVHPLHLYEAKLIAYRMNDYRPPVVLRSANLADLNLTNQYDRRALIHLSLEGTIMIRPDFHEMNRHGARFKRATLNYANFSSTWNTPAFDEYDDLSGFKNNFLRLSFENANLTSTSFVAATYDNANFDSAIMTNANLNKFFCANCVYEFYTMFIC